MTVLECYQYVQERMNKNSSNANDNIEKYSFVGAFNASQLLWVENRIKLDETNSVRIDEIERLLLTYSKKPTLIEGKNYYELSLPDDYFHYKRSVSYIPCLIYNWLKKEGDINRLLQDEFWKPSVEWGETLCTLVGNKLRVYVDDFTISNIDLIYYRYPININMATGFVDVNGNITTNINPEFQGSSLIEILNETCNLLASDINDQSRYQTSAQRIQKNT